MTSAQHARVENLGAKAQGLQPHPEVTCSPVGPTTLKSFVIKIAGTKLDWVMTDYANELMEDVRQKAGPNGRVIEAARPVAGWAARLRQLS